MPDMPDLLGQSCICYFPAFFISARMNGRNKKDMILVDNIRVMRAMKTTENPYIKTEIGCMSFMIDHSS